MKFLGKVFNNRVSKSVCTEIQKANIQAHDSLEDCIEGSMQRCETRSVELHKLVQTRFSELKGDMTREFDEVKSMIRTNGTR